MGVAVFTKPGSIGILFSHIKGGNTDTQMNLEDIMIGAISQTQKDKYVIPLTGGPQTSQIHRDRK